MRLTEELKKTSETDESMFRRHLAREDLARLETLTGMARSLKREAFLKEGLYIGWTQNDMTTHRLKDEITALLEALFDYEAQGETQSGEEGLRRAFAAFARARMQKLIHCL